MTFEGICGVVYSGRLTKLQSY